MKKCVQCGADLPDGASLCPYCAASQVERHTVSPPRRINRFRLRRVIMTAAVTASLVGSAVAIVLGVRAIREKERREAEAAALAALEAQQEAVDSQDRLPLRRHAWAGLMSARAPTTPGALIAPGILLSASGIRALPFIMAAILSIGNTAPIRES